MFFINYIKKIKFKNGFQKYRIQIQKWISNFNFKIEIINKKIKFKNLPHYIIIIINTYTNTHTYTIYKYNYTYKYIYNYTYKYIYKYIIILYSI